MLRGFLLAVVAVLAAVLLPGCGSSGDPARIGEHSVTESEFLSVFHGLPAEEQVAVLEPGGRMALMERIVRKRLLLLAWEADPSVSEDWEELYTISYLSDSMFARLAGSFDPQAYSDSIAACGYSAFSLELVLLDDSVDAAVTADAWNSGETGTLLPSVTAPWSRTGGGSYRTLEGTVDRLTADFLPLLDMQTGTAHVIPMYGEWAVCRLELVPGVFEPDGSTPAAGLMALIAEATDETVLAEGVSALTGQCRVSGTLLVPDGEGDETPVIILPDRTVTTSDILRMMTMVSPENFFGEVPAELYFFSTPQVSVSPEVTVWFYVKTLAQRLALASMAADAGVALEEGTMDFARAEAVVRERVLYETRPDSSSVAEWFAGNPELFQLPERRSVLLGYTDSLAVPEGSSPASLLDIPGLDTPLDDSGAMIPTPPQVRESFGDVLGEAVFSAAPGELTGPVHLGGELAAWFEVVEVVPPGTAELDEVYPFASAAASAGMFQEGFDNLIEELMNDYPVEVDTAAVERIDLWGPVQ